MGAGDGGRGWEQGVAAGVWICRRSRMLLLHGALVLGKMSWLVCVSACQATKLVWAGCGTCGTMHCDGNNLVADSLKIKRR